MPYWLLLLVIRGVTERGGPQVVVDIDVSDNVIWNEPNLIAIGYLAEAEVAALRVDEPADL